MISQHLGKALTEEQRARWVELICLSAKEGGLPSDAEFQAAFRSYIEWRSRIALENSQLGAKPALHMPMPSWWWVCDATPGSRASALETSGAETLRAALELPKPDEEIGFDQHIKPRFRERDRKSMKLAFELWSYVTMSATTLTRSWSASRQGRCPATEHGRANGSRCSSDGLRPA